MKIEVWSDVVCPWCYIGKRRLETALSRFEHREGVEVVWRSFQLDQSAPYSSDESTNEILAKKYGMSLQKAADTTRDMTELAARDGLEYHLDKAQHTNTFRAHQLIHLAAIHGLQDALKERLLKAYFTEGLAVGDIDTLVGLAGEVGLPEAEARAALVNDSYAEAVIADEQRASALGIRGVPFFVFDEKYGVSGAQPAEVLLKVLEKAWAETHPLIMVGADSEQDMNSCSDDSCAV